MKKLLNTLRTTSAIAAMFGLAATLAATPLDFGPGYTVKAASAFAKNGADDGPGDDNGGDRGDGESDDGPGDDNGGDRDDGDSDDGDDSDDRDDSDDDDSDDDSKNRDRNRDRNRSDDSSRSSAANPLTLLFGTPSWMK